LVTRVQFEPKTGRTHQLRLHSSHPKGLGLPIVGDRLYGSGMQDRLYLHAQMIKFAHPATGILMTFRAETPF
jgi:tRNA pseudouridine32 synthase/23S rRNA pseudouridine746 synthase